MPEMDLSGIMVRGRCQYSMAYMLHDLTQWYSGKVITRTVEDGWELLDIKG